MSGSSKKESDHDQHDSQSTPRYTSITGSITEEDEDAPTERTASPATITEVPTQSRRDYGTIPGWQSSTRQALALNRPLESLSTHNSAASSSHALPTSPIAQRPKKPPTMRRMSTKRGVPHRGEVFSVEDNPDEIEEDRAPQTPIAINFPPLLRATSTVRRRTQQSVPQLPRIESQGDEDDDAAPVSHQEQHAEPEEPDADPDDVEADEDAEEEDLSDTESFTLKDRQLAINETHPFGIKIWKPALYKKNRSVEKNADEDIHSTPSQIVSGYLWFFNCLWTLIFGWWLALAALLSALICFIFVIDPSAVEYGRVFWGLSWYLFWPFGQFVKLVQDENYTDEDEGEGRSIGEYERWQSGDLEYGRLMFGPSLTHTGSIIGRHRSSIDSEADERDSLLGRNGRADTDGPETNGNGHKRRMFGRGQWTLGRVIFFVFFYFLVAPLMLLVSLICWLMVFWIPMGRVTLILFYHLRKRPLALSFHPDISDARDTTQPSQILLCTYRAVGLKYWKYTVDGTNIFLINFLGVVAFVIFDYFVLRNALQLKIFLTSPGLLFVLSLMSIIPLAYFIGQAVASISAQSSMGMGAAVNAFFSTIVEVYLYCIALNEGKGKLVEGSLVGSIFAGILLLPGLSMCAGAIKRKTQRFNVKSAGATSTMLLFAVIAAFGPTLFYKIYGSHELICRTCTGSGADPGSDQPRDCRQCYFRQVPAITDEFFINAVRPFCWIAAAFLFGSYFIGLLFTLRTHAAVIWNAELDEKKAHDGQTTEISPLDTRAPSRMEASHGSIGHANAKYVARSHIRESQLYKRILGHSLQQAGLSADGMDGIVERERPDKAASYPGTDVQDHQPKADLPHVVPPKSSHSEHVQSPIVRSVIPGLTEEQNNDLFQQVAEMAATAATVAARDAVQHPKTASYEATHSNSLHKMNGMGLSRPATTRGSTTLAASGAAAEQAGHHAPPEAAAPGGHDAPNWSRTKSSIILLTATFAYAIIAEVLVNTVDVVLESVDIDEKFLGFTLFALVPSTTEFLNAISFAINGNVALSMEIGSAYTLQVCLLQFPALVFFSAVHGRFINPVDLVNHTFNMIFPQWDMVTVILCVFLLSYIYSEGKSNYFKGSILVLTYLTVLMGFYFAGYTSLDVLGVDPSDTLAIIGSSAWQQRGDFSPARTKRSEL